MAKCFEQSHQAYSQGDKAGAKTLSNSGKEHQRQIERLNKEASDWIFIGTALFPIARAASGINIVYREQQGLSLNMWFA